MIGCIIFVVVVVAIVVVIVDAKVCQKCNANRKEKWKKTLKNTWPSDIENIEKYCKDYIESNSYCVGLDEHFRPYKYIKDSIIGMEGRCKLGYYDSYTEEEKQLVLQHYKELQQKLKNMDDKYPLFKDVYDTMRNRKIKELNEQKIKTLCFPKYPRD